MKKVAFLLAAGTIPGTAVALDVSVGGQVNKAVMAYDDGRSTDFAIVDNNLSGTEFNFAGEQKLDNGLTASVYLAADVAGNASHAITQNTATGRSSAPTDGGAATVTEQMARVGLAGKWGAVFLGQQDTAVDDAFYRDLGAAGDVLGNGVTAFGGGLGFRASATGAITSLGGQTLTPGVLSLGLDGSTEYQSSIRFNTPTWNGFDASVSASQGGDIDTNLRYAATYDKVEVDGAVGIAFENSGATATNSPDQTIYGSVSALHASGVAVTAAVVSRELERKTAGKDDPFGYYAKLSYKTGNLGLGIDYANFSDTIATATVNHDMTSFGVGAQYDLSESVSVGALYRTFDADIAGTATDAINVYGANLFIRF